MSVFGLALLSQIEDYASKLSTKSLSVCTLTHAVSLVPRKARTEDAKKV